MEKINFNQGWTFYKDGQPGTSQVLDLPHDAMLHEQRDPDSPGTSAIAFFQGGKYVYEKTFAVPTEWQERVVTFEFEVSTRTARCTSMTGKLAGGLMAIHASL